MKYHPIGLLPVLSALSLAAIAAAQSPGSFEDHVVRTIEGNRAGARLGEHLLFEDTDGDGYLDVIVTVRGLTEVRRIDGKLGTVQTLRGPTGSGFGAAIAIGDVMQAGTDALVIASLGRGSGGHITIVDPSNLTQSIGGFPIPVSRGVPRDIFLADTDFDSRDEIIIQDPVANAGAGQVTLWDPWQELNGPAGQGWVWTADGTASGGNFGVQVASPPPTPAATSTAQLLVAEPGTDTIWSVDPATGAKTSFATHGTTGALGRDGLVATKGGLIVASSEFTGFGAPPNGVLEKFDDTSLTWTTLYPGGVDERIMSLTRPDASGRFYFSTATPASEQVLELDPLVPGAVIATQGPPGEGLRVHRDGPLALFNNNDTDAIALSSPFRASAIGQGFAGEAWVYSLDPLDARVEESQVSSGQAFNIHANFGPGRAGDLVFPVVSGTGNDLTFLPGLNVPIAVQLDIWTNYSLVLVPGAPFALDNAGKASAQMPLPSAPLGGQIFGFHFAWLGAGQNGFFASTDGTGSNGVIN